MGPVFGVMMVDYYLIRKGEMNVEALYYALRTAAVGSGTRAARA